MYHSQTQRYSKRCHHKIIEAFGSAMQDQEEDEFCSPVYMLLEVNDVKL